MKSVTYPNAQFIQSPPLIGEYAYFDTRVKRDNLPIRIFLVKTDKYKNNNVQCHYSTVFKRPEEDCCVCQGIIINLNIL